MATALEQLAADIAARQQTIEGQIPGEDQIKTLISEALNGIDPESPFARKMRFGSDAADQKIVGSKFSRWGLTAADIEYAYDVQTSLRGQGRREGGVFPGPSEELENTFKAVSDAYYLSDEEVKTIDVRAIDNMFSRIPKSQFRSRKDRDAAYDRAVRAATMDTTQSGYGQQLVGAQYVGDIWDAAFAEGRVAPLINTFEMTAPTAYLPVAVDMPEPMLVSESTSDVLATAQYPTVRTGSNRVQVDAKKFVTHQVWSAEMEEDSIIPYVPYLRQQATRSLSFYTDSLVLNGDTTNAATGNINLDDADPIDTKYYLGFDGIRHVGLVDNTSNQIDVAGPVSLNLLRDLPGLMLDSARFVDWGHPNDPSDLVFVVDPATGDRIATLDEVLSAKIQNGNNANLLNGQVASIIGHPVISTPAISLTEADGKVSTTGGNNTKGQVVAFNVGGFVIGWRRRLRIITEMIPASDQSRIVYSWRFGFGRYTPTGSASAIDSAAVGFNIAL